MSRNSFQRLFEAIYVLDWVHLGLVSITLVQFVFTLPLTLCVCSACCLVVCCLLQGLSKPKGIRFSDVTDTSAAVHWSVPHYSVDSYQVTYVPIHGGKCSLYHRHVLAFCLLLHGLLWRFIFYDVLSTSPAEVQCSMGIVNARIRSTSLELTNHPSSLPL